LTFSPAVLRQSQAWQWSHVPVSLVTQHVLSCIQPLAIRLSLPPLCNTFSVKQGIDGEGASVAFFSQALSCFPSPGRLLHQFCADSLFWGDWCCHCQNTDRPFLWLLTGVGHIPVGAFVTSRSLAGCLAAPFIAYSFRPWLRASLSDLPLPMRRCCFTSWFVRRWMHGQYSSLWSPWVVQDGPGAPTAQWRPELWCPAAACPAYPSVLSKLIMARANALMSTYVTYALFAFVLACTISFFIAFNWSEINCSARCILAACDTSCSIISDYTVGSQHKMDLFHNSVRTVYYFLTLHKSQSWLTEYKCFLQHCDKVSAALCIDRYRCCYLSCTHSHSEVHTYLKWCSFHLATVDWRCAPLSCTFICAGHTVSACKSIIVYF
jgi:hypothetical protein